VGPNSLLCNCFGENVTTTPPLSTLRGLSLSLVPLPIGRTGRLILVSSVWPGTRLSLGQAEGAVRSQELPAICQHSRITCKAVLVWWHVHTCELVLVEAALAQPPYVPSFGAVLLCWHVVGADDLGVVGGRGLADCLGVTRREREKD
jgi:hypothetical protein